MTGEDIDSDNDVDKNADAEVYTGKLIGDEIDTDDVVNGISIEEIEDVSEVAANDIII